MSTKTIVLAILIIAFLALVIIDGKKKLKQNSNKQEDEA